MCEDLLCLLTEFQWAASHFTLAGLMKDDILYENADVQEALRRLPENVYNDRMFRIKRALDLSMKHQILPKDQWTKYEEVKSCQIICFGTTCIFAKKKTLERHSASEYNVFMS